MGRLFPGAVRRLAVWVLILAGIAAVRAAAVPQTQMVEESAVGAPVALATPEAEGAGIAGKQEVASAFDASQPELALDLPPGLATPSPLATSVPTVLTPSACLTVHIVRQGDTLERLARRFHTTARAIQTANRLRGTVIFVGQKLVIPVSPVTCPPTWLPARAPTCVPTCPSGCAPVCPTPTPPICVPRCPAPRVHVVQRGEDIFRIALRFDVSVAVLMQLNGLQTTALKPGQVLMVPNP